MSAADIKYYDAARAAEDFGVFQSLTYRAVKAVNPKIRVSGFNSYASKGGGDWSRGVAAGGGCRAAGLSAPVRYIHSPSCVGNVQDFEAMKVLVRAFLERMEDYDG